MGKISNRLALETWGVFWDSPLQFFFLDSSLGCKKFALLKSVEQNNWFKKQHFLNRLNKITDLKSTPKGGIQKQKIARGNLKKPLMFLMLVCCLSYPFIFYETNLSLKNIQYGKIILEFMESVLLKYNR
jgi:hypothetical protein